MEDSANDLYDFKYEATLITTNGFSFKATKNGNIVITKHTIAWLAVADINIEIGNINI